MSEALLERLIDFAEAGNQQKITLEGTTYQGWVMEITEEGLLISTGYNDKKGKDIWLSPSQLQKANLSFWNNANSQWEVFTL
ncbi:hypothetical protein [Acinetobacter sp. HY1485]|uniref:hypothetical protein n=1 Tax=Acinetobacter sp. HY1485 TaxID=2970918 RepID=UPI0022B97682|nr:hypothetical protein [Acinetobacter sp. HY1485]